MQIANGDTAATATNAQRLAFTDLQQQLKMTDSLALAGGLALAWPPLHILIVHPA